MAYEEKNCNAEREEMGKLGCQDGNSFFAWHDDSEWLFYTSSIIFLRFKNTIQGQVQC